MRAHRPSHGTVVAYVALVVAMSGTAVAATGGNFLLGKTNSAGATSSLRNSGTGPALALRATGPVFSVSNSTRVPSLNADRVDGRHAVGASTALAQRAGKLVAADGNGRLPDSARLGGYSHAQMSHMSIPPQATYVSSGASQSESGPVLSPSTDGAMTVAFVVPPDHKSGSPLTMRVSYAEDSAGACAWSVVTAGLEGPDGPNSQANIHNGGWQVPGTTIFEGTVAVTAGAGSEHSATFSWPFTATPGMFIQFALTRDGANGADTCGYVTINGLQLAY